MSKINESIKHLNRVNKNFDDFDKRRKEKIGDPNNYFYERRIKTIKRKGRG